MFSDRLKTLREESGLTQKQLAQKLGLSQGTVGNWESGTREPKLKTLQTIADYFGTTTDYLLGNTEQRTSPPTSETPAVYLHLLQGAKRLDLDQHDVDLLLDIAKRLKERDD